ncbi:MAG: DUF4093 domain-containing protein [Clostridiales bacterium]|nr:DUF4093 domain-containing protein [Clostridiales bacterium]
MIKIKEAVIVEGKYDKIKLSNILDALIIEINGFHIYNDREKINFIRKLASERGIIILTDSDHSGFQIRNFISRGIDRNKIKNIYIPDVFGKEKRKQAPSKEGKLGVEGISDDILIKLFSENNISYAAEEKNDLITNYDLYTHGFSGVPNSKEKKKKLLKSLELPEFLSTNSLLSYLNYKMTKTEFENYITTI